MSTLKEMYDIRDERNDIIPEKFTQEKFEYSEMPFYEPLNNFSAKGTPLWHFATDKKVLISSKPIAVKVSEGETSYFVDNETLDIYAIGDSVQNAMIDFCVQLVDFYDHYRNLRKEDANENALKLKKIYSEIFSVVT